MNEQTAEAPQVTDTLVSPSQRVIIGSDEDTRTIVVKPFVFAKSLLAFRLLGQLAESAGIGEVVKAAEQSAASGEFDQAIAGTFITKLLLAIPNAIESGSPLVLKIVGLIATSNAQLRRLEDGASDVDEALLKEGRDIAYTATNDQLVSLLVVGANSLGMASIVKNLPALAGLLRAK